MKPPTANKIKTTHLNTAKKHEKQPQRRFLTKTNHKTRKTINKTTKTNQKQQKPANHPTEKTLIIGNQL